MADTVRWNERYRTGDTPWDTGKPSAELVRVVAEEAITPCRAVEMGCGTGTNAVWLAQQGFDVTAVDVSSLALDRARKRAADAGVRVDFREADVLAAPDLGGPFDFLFDRGCYHVVRRDNVAAYLDAVRAATRPGTVALVLAGNAREVHSPGPPVVTEEELRGELGRLFEVRRLREFRFDQEEAGGVRYLGWSCLLRRPG